MSSFKSPPMSLLDMAISFMRGIGLITKDERVVVIPEEKWHAMHERHEADVKALADEQAEGKDMYRAYRAALKSSSEWNEKAHDWEMRARAAEARVEALTAELATARGQP